MIVAFFSCQSLNPDKCLTDIEITEQIIIDSIQELSSTSAAGTDGVPSSLLLKCAAELAPALKVMFSQSLTHGFIPSSLKRAAITSVFKSGTKTSPSNYRPISLTSTIIKVFERIIRKQVVAFMNRLGHLNNTQHGFRSGRSCLSALLDVFDDLMHIQKCAYSLLIHDTHADIITIQETKLTPKAKTPKIHNFTSVRTDRLHKAGGGLITLIRDNITFTTTDIPSTINTHNIELQMVKVHINNTKHITIANIYIPPRDTTSTHYKTADTNIQHCIQYITNIPHSVLTGDVNAHFTLWHSYTDDHRGQLIADVISNSDHITLNTNTPTRVPNTTLQQTSSPRCLTHFTTGHRGQLSTHYHQTTYP